MNASMIQQCKKYDLDISAEYKNISMNDINNAHQNGIRISVWLCRNEDMVDIFRKMGADYITYEKWNTDEVKMRYYSPVSYTHLIIFSPLTSCVYVYINDPDSTRSFRYI